MEGNILLPNTAASLAKIDRMVHRKQVEQRIIEKAMKDEHFRMQFIDNPKLTMEQETGMRLPDYLNIIVLEEDAQTLYMVLPPSPTVGREGELSDSDLESLAGGTYGEGNDELTYGSRFLECFS